MTTTPSCPAASAARPSLVGSVRRVGPERGHHVRWRRSAALPGGAASVDGSTPSAWSYVEEPRPQHFVPPGSTRNRLIVSWNGRGAPSSVSARVCRRGSARHGEAVDDGHQSPGTRVVISARVRVNTRPGCPDRRTGAPDPRPVELVLHRRPPQRGHRRPRPKAPSRPASGTPVCRPAGRPPPRPDAGGQREDGGAAQRSREHDRPTDGRHRDSGGGPRPRRP